MPNAAATPVTAPPTAIAYSHSAPNTCHVWPVSAPSTPSKYTVTHARQQRRVSRRVSSCASANVAGLRTLPIMRPKTAAPTDAPIEMKMMA